MLLVGQAWPLGAADLTSTSRFGQRDVGAIEVRLFVVATGARRLSPEAPTSRQSGAARRRRRRKRKPGNARDLIIGLITPIGVDRAPVKTALRNQLRIVNYSAKEIKVSNFIDGFLRAINPSWIPDDHLERKDVFMDVGNIVRQYTGSGDAFARLCLVEIASLRRRLSHTSTGIAYVVDSLKHPDEVELFRSVYGPAFVAVGVFATPHTREQHLESKASTLLPHPHRPTVRHLMERDEDEDLDLGQQVRAAFELSDVVLDLNRTDLEAQTKRMVELLFGDLQKMPTPGEYGMAVARMAQARSSSLGRQVGAVIMRPDNSVAAVGRNDVARPYGGQYEAADDAQYPEGRDVSRGQDTSDWFRQKALTDVIALLQEHNELVSTDNPEALFRKWYIGEENGPRPWLRKTKIASTIDYIRAVHAESAAIIDAARNGVDINGCTMYTTTFPCHDCAKHILASGIRELIYWAPYPKSMVHELYQDSITINEPSTHPEKVQFHSFVGIAPNRYPDFFIMGKRERKTKEGNPILFDSDTATVTLPPYAAPEEVVLLNEAKITRPFIRKFKKRIDDLYARIRQNHTDRETPAEAPA
jgi:cytidine deaminase